MATKAFHLCFCIFLFLVALPLHSHANPSKPKAEKPSPFEFIKHLEGCHKGEKVEGLQQLKAYLEKFGYLNYNHSQNQNHANDNDFDDLLEAAVKTYQLNYHLKATGTLDVKTVSNMMKPRCGNADIINGTNWMRGGKKRPNQAHNTFHTVSHYAFLPGSPKWLSNQLTYAFLPGTNSDAQSAVARAFEKWAAQTHFTFSRSQDLGSANLKIGFGRLDHGDGIQNAFDGPWGTIAHAFPPTDGTFHYDADESWSVGAEPNSIDYETVALHEIGHLLGLDHSSVREAIMYAEAPVGVTKGLHGDDIEGIKALYNIA
ncbi:hypothetical protein RHGRI_004022 [Rhododendron griersonianum]|uniref:Peptidase metallopeptidase domain-containing protein n=1 Tax=Rhododendron griersonianum TaxID=479676 RepID=A0AAV6L9Z6_9ERIC|nr:hypothetical protein RHGRI_004022 [Rhododendron griersonianum]